jgi:hypothetical protein
MIFRGMVPPVARCRPALDLRTRILRIPARPGQLTPKALFA